MWLNPDYQDLFFGQDYSCLYLDMLSILFEAKTCLSVAGVENWLIMGLILLGESGFWAGLVRS
jgi:hypothetical protein